MKTKLLLIGLVAAILSALLATTPASASTVPFAAQARAAGLTASQAQALQGQVNSYLARTGGTQTAINRINLAGTGELVLSMPGQVHPDATCYGGDFCAWSGANRTGSFLSKYVCSKFDIPWTTTGSWLNNQSSGTKAKFYNSAGTVIFTTPGAVSSDNSYNWAPVFKILPC